MGDVIGWSLNALHGILVWFQTLVPGGFGLILIPLTILGIVTLLAARRA